MLFLVPLLLAVCGGATAQNAAPAPLFRDPSKPIEARIKDLVSHLTL